MKEILETNDIESRLDIKSLVLDLVKRHFSHEQIMQMFYDHLPQLDEEYIRKFIFMRRDH